MVLDPLPLLERLCALVPRPRQMLPTYHGVLAPAAGYRHLVVPPRPLPDPDDPEGCRHHPDAPRQPRQRDAADGGTRSPMAAAAPAAAAAQAPPRQPFVPHAPARKSLPRRRYSWSELMQRVSESDVLVCRWCSGPRSLLAAILDPDSIARILTHLGLDPQPPQLERARSPPEPRLPW